MTAWVNPDRPLILGLLDLGMATGINVGQIRLDNPFFESAYGLPVPGPSK